MNVESFIINGENMLGKNGVSELINIIKKKHDDITFTIKYTVPNTTYPHSTVYEYEINRFEDLDKFIDKYILG